MKTDDDDDEMQKIQRIYSFLKFLFNIFFKPRRNYCISLSSIAHFIGYLWPDQFMLQ